MQTDNEILEVTVPEGKDVVVITVPEGVEVQLQHTAEEAPKAEPTKLDNILTLGLVGVLALIAIIAVIRKAVTGKKKAKVVVEEAPAPVVEAPAAPGTAGSLKLYNVEPKTAAMVMAIVANKLEKPLNELRFISIKEVN